MEIVTTMTITTLLIIKGTIFASASSCEPPPNFPPDIQWTQEPFTNWVGTIVVSSLLTATPKSDDEVVQLINWAYSEKYKVRPLGFGFGWSPLVVSSTQECENILAINTTSLNSMEIFSNNNNDNGLTSVKVGVGVTVNELLEYLETKGFGLNQAPSLGYATIGGVISGGGHGNSVSSNSESLLPGFTFGSLSNLVISLKAAVWNNSTSSYSLKTFNRNDSDTKAFIVNLGRAFLTEVTLRVGPNYNLQCVSITNIPETELYKNPNDVQPGDRTYASLVEASGRISSIWFAFSKNPWIRTFYNKAEKPFGSREVHAPYAYTFSDNVPTTISDYLPQITNSVPWLTPAFGNLQSSTATLGLAATFTYNLWGPSKNLLLFVKPTTLKIFVNGYATITKRANIQLVVSEYMKLFKDLIYEFKNNGKYPINIGNEIRVTGLDVSNDVGIIGSESPSLSPSSPVSNHPEFDVAIWMDIVTLPGTKFLEEFAMKLEKSLFSHFDETVAIVRPEWSKGFAYDESSAWANLETLEKIPNLYSEWNFTSATLNEYDPHRLFTNDLLDKLMP